MRAGGDTYRQLLGYRNVIGAAVGVVQRLGELALIRHLEAPRKARLVRLERALDDAGNRLDGGRGALHHARRADFRFAVLLAREQLLAALALEHVGVFEEELAEDGVLAVEAAVQAHELVELVGARADGRFGKDGAVQGLAAAVNVRLLGEARGRRVGHELVRLLRVGRVDVVLRARAGAVVSGGCVDWRGALRTGLPHRAQ